MCFVARWPLVRANAFLCRRWAATPLFTRGKILLLLLYPVGQQPSYSRSIAAANRKFLIKKPLNPLCFSHSQMALPYFGTHNFTATSNMEAALRNFMGSHFRHLVLFYLFVYLFSFGFLISYRCQDNIHSSPIHQWLPLNRNYPLQ